MRRRCGVGLLLALGACTATRGADAGPPDAAVDAGDGPWRSALYPEDWTPAFTDDAGRFLHDFSYAGYALGERAPALPAFEVRVANDGGDMTTGLQAAIDLAQAADGGVVLLPAGTWRVDGTLRVTRSNVVLRGEGVDATRLLFTRSWGLDGAEHVRVGGTHRYTGEWPLAADGASRAFSVRVGPSDAGVLRPGDDVALGFVVSDAFVAEHGMTGTWSAFNGTWQPFAWRTVKAVASDGTVTLDVPLRSAALMRDGASLRRVEGLLREVGVEQLAVTNAVDPAAAWGMTQVHVVTFSGVKDGWLRDVASFSADGGAHVQSGGVRVHQSSRVTLERARFEKAQHRGPGGNGYLFEVRQSSEVLYRDCEGRDGRHNFIQNWGFGTTGCVWLRVTSACGFATATAGGTQGGVGYSEFHHSLATANLVDSSRFDDGWSIVNRHGESTGAGHTGTETVVWNASGAGLLRSMQWGWGYVVGTRDITVSTRDLFGFFDQGTEPWDFTEGLDAGARLEPPSLYEDQLRRRLGRPP